MKFAHPWWLFGTGLAVVVAALLILGGFMLIRSVRRFGEEERVAGLVTGAAGARRATKGVLLVLAVALGFVALAKPQYGKGTRLIPATNLDVVIVLDYSKSMYARDVTPSRIARAKTEVGQLISQLPGARFGAVAFAGEPISFPLTSDGGAIAQFFRQLAPNDMPIGGTAIGRALEAGRSLLERDPKSKNHRKVILLVTDGEDLEGDPVAVARAAAEDKIAISVVQIGGRTPEPIPEVNAAGEVAGWRTTDDGDPITTSLSASGEEQLGTIATSTGGTVVRSERGSTGINEIAQQLSKMMTEELSESVETVYADVYAYPLGAAVLLLIVETFVSQTRPRPKPTVVAPPARRRRRRKRKTRAAQAAVSSALAIGLWTFGCEDGRDQVFIRSSPVVEEAIAALDGGDASAAAELLQGYLSTGKCKSGVIGIPDELRDLPNAGFDLGLALFDLGERFGQRFGDEGILGDAGPTPQEQELLLKRGEQVDCALRVVERISAERSVPLDLRARASYLAGNLEFLRGDYHAAVQHYDRALRLIPGLPADAGVDGVGRKAAWNRAVALRRIEEQEPPDASPDGDPDGSEGDAGGDSGEQDPDGGADGGNESDDGGDDQNGNDAGPDGSDQQQPPEDEPDEQDKPEEEPPKPEPPQSVNQDERMLDMLEMAPTLQQQNAKDRALRRPVKGMVDK